LSINHDIDETIYPLTLADHKPVPWPQTPHEGARPQTPVEIAAGLFPGEQLDEEWYRGTSLLQLQERDARRRAHYWRLKHIEAI
jgi:hypothetical protein